MKLLLTIGGDFWNPTRLQHAHHIVGVEHEHATVHDPDSAAHPLGARGGPG